MLQKNFQAVLDRALELGINHIETATVSTTLMYILLHASSFYERPLLLLSIDAAVFGLMMSQANSSTIVIKRESVFLTHMLRSYIINTALHRQCYHFSFQYGASLHASLLHHAYIYALAHMLRCCIMHTCMYTHAIIVITHRAMALVSCSLGLLCLSLSTLVRATYCRLRSVLKRIRKCSEKH
jgi:hypothetical protein